MSLGETDTLWWNRICTWLRGSDARHLIIQNYDRSNKGVYPLQYQLAEKRKKKEILAFSDFDSNIKTALMKRIHITGDNIFSDINNVAKEITPKRSKIIENKEIVKQAQDDVG